jgi:hypothetical protein
MRFTRVATGILLVSLVVASPLLAQDGRRRRGNDDRGRQNQEQGERRNDGRTTGRAVPRETVRPYDAPRQSDAGRPDRNNARRNDQARRGADYGRYDNRGYDRTYRGSGRAYYPYYANRGYGARTVIVPRFVRPTIVTVAPYRPYHYRPSIGIGIYYGAGGYPYGYTPRGYYDPIPGRPYGGLRIVGVSRDAQVFADGYYLGIVDDFDGIFQHANLEAGAHRIEIQAPGFESVAFDVMVQPGRTITFRADMYPY